jgi:hypothetical protein
MCSILNRMLHCLESHVSFKILGLKPACGFSHGMPLGVPFLSGVSVNSVTTLKAPSVYPRCRAYHHELCHPTDGVTHTEGTIGLTEMQSLVVWL